MSEDYIQDQYPDAASHCFGCGRLNENGLHIKSFWNGEEAVCHFEPAPYHVAIPGYVYGGLIASLIDCHSTGTAAAASMSAADQGESKAQASRFLTASLHVDYLRPTPLGVTLEVRAKVKEMKGRKAVISSALYAEGIECARGEVVAVRTPERLISEA